MGPADHAAAVCLLVIAGGHRHSRNGNEGQKGPGTEAMLAGVRGARPRLVGLGIRGGMSMVSEGTLYDSGPRTSRMGTGVERRTSSVVLPSSVSKRP